MAVPLEKTADTDPTHAAEPPASLDPIAAQSGDGVRSSKKAMQEKMDWLDAVLAGRPRMPPTTFTVAFVVAQHWNSRDREAWPSQRRMMLLTGVSETTLRASLRTLIDRGYLEQAKRGVRNGNKYRLCTPEAAVTPV